MKANELLKEDPNLHLTHLEDLALFQGKEGASKAIEYLNNLAELASSGSSKKFNGLTIPWDGSPHIHCKDPQMENPLWAQKVCPTKTQS